MLLAIVEANGVAGQVRVSRAISHGLDEKAIETLRQWRFKPATKDGKPVAARINVEMRFHLY